MYFLNINKPKGITSFDVIRQLRKKLKIKAIGHSGTLDPMATGVLQIGVGSATKLLEYLPSDKKYYAKIRFGYVSDTYDAEGNITFIKKPDFSKEDLTDTLNKFLGKTLQIPPKYSAIKLNGKKLCDIVRKNSDIEIEIKPRGVEIFSIDLLNFDSDTAEIEVFCKKGTYIRSLVNDIGEKLGCGAYLTELTRLQAGNFKIENSQPLDSASYNNINPLDALEFDRYELNEDEYFRIKNGNYIITDKKFLTNSVLLTKNKILVSVADLSDNKLKPVKNFNEV